MGTPDGVEDIFSSPCSPRSDDLGYEYAALRAGEFAPEK
jgi:hypothetical protein